MKLIKNKKVFTTQYRTELKKLLDKKYGIETTTKHYRDDNGLHKQIYNKVGEYIGGSTLERLVGLTKTDVYPSKGTLNIVAQFLDFKSAEHLLKILDYKTSNLKDDDNGFRNNNLFKEHNLLIELKNTKSVVLKCNYDNNYTVIKSKNIKLLPKDNIELSLLKIGSTFNCCSVKRKKKTIVFLGGYSSNDSTVIGISFVK